jgi:DNA-binding transcriptional MerR regulator
MSEDIDPKYIDEVVAKGPQSALERLFIEEYLREKGYCIEELKELPEEEARQIMSEACKYASLKLAEVESRAQFRERIRAPS